MAHELTSHNQTQFTTDHPPFPYHAYHNLVFSTLKSGKTYRSEDAMVRPSLTVPNVEAGQSHNTLHHPPITSIPP